MIDNFPLAKHTNTVVGTTPVSDCIETQVLETVKMTLREIVVSPATAIDTPISTQLIQAILSNKKNEGDASYTGQMNVEGYDVTFKQNEGSSQLELAIHGLSFSSTILPNITMAELKKAMLMHYIASETRLGNVAIDLSSFDLSDVDLTDINFTGTVLGQVNLDAIISNISNKTAIKADLSGASLANGTNVKNMPFAGVKLDRDMLSALIDGYANLMGIDVSGQDLSGISLINVNFSHANFTNTNLTDANLKCANFTDANLTRVILTNASIGLTILPRALAGNDINLNGTLGIPIRDLNYTFKYLPQMFYRTHFNIYNPKGVKSDIDLITPHFKIGKKYECPNQTRNCLAAFSDGRGFIACRHTATQFVFDVLSHPNSKFNFRVFSSVQSLASHIPLTIEHAYDDVRMYAKQIHIINNDNFGKFLSVQFLQMEVDGTNVRAMLLESSNHSMAFRLRIATYDKDRLYSVQFMEPNIGEASPIQSRVTNPHQLTKQKLFDYIIKEHNYRNYFKGTGEFSIVFVHDTESINPLSEQRRAIKQITSCDISKIMPIHIWYMMNNNLHIDLLNLKDKLVELSQPNLYIVLGIDGFTMETPTHTSVDLKPIEQAFAMCQVEAIKAYGELLELVTDEKKRAELLCIDKYGISKDSTLEEVTSVIDTAFSQLGFSLEQKHSKPLKAYKKIADKLFH